MKKNIVRVALTGLCFLTLLISCKKKSDDPKPSTGTESTVSEFKGTFGTTAVDVKVTDGISNVNSPGVSSNKDLNSTGDSSSATYSSEILSEDSKTYISLTTQRFKFMGGTSPSDAIFKSYFEKAAYKYKTNSQDGIVITYYLGDEVWSTMSSAADQSSSTITFTNVENYSYIFEEFVRVKATFTCNVYNSNGDKKVLTGTFLALFENI